MDDVADLVETVIQGNAKESVFIARDLLAKGYRITQLVEGLTRALDSLDAKCNMNQFNLLEILLAARAMKEVVDEVVCPEMEKLPAEFGSFRLKGVFVMGTIQGDIHDLGKNIVTTLLRTVGYKVIDLGKDVPPAQFVMTAKAEKADFIGVSSLIFSSAAGIREIKRLLREENRADIMVIAGGASVKQLEKEDLDVDMIAKDAFELIRFLQVYEGNVVE
ncbi:cobalamin B12-binding domain-containing protein [Desulfosporosinus youngiae]|uniref:Putative cobalamin binding protein n=1 Tax=Desulfosporosinus youngiae DSM 17734 TaxID=768710 RepID=H5XXS8_9FIRM|nr:cobalamin-dependent protein [Desulfosporosinus youngiae]EHQ91357.1 putative cobalamin binding protein [Desulfosporosinus youngiae DSM 17734]